MKTVVRGLVALLVLFVVGNVAHGLTFTATGQGDNTNKILSASVTFAVSDLKLVITLANTATFDPDDSADILTGVFFTLVGDPLLTRTSALLGSDTAIEARSGVSGPGMNVGGQWAYRNDLTDLTNEPNEGLAIAGLKNFSKKPYRFSGPKLASPSGVQYGVTTDFDNLGNDKASLKHQQLIENTVVFTMGGLPTNFTFADISNVSFQYGTGPSAADLAGTVSGSGVPVIPEPNTIALVAAGLLGGVHLRAATKGRRPRSRMPRGAPNQPHWRPAAQPSARGSPGEQSFGWSIGQQNVKENSLSCEKVDSA